MTHAAHGSTPGACLCGTLRYDVDGPFSMMLNCHCSMCRKHHGTAFATFVAAPLIGFHWASGEDNVSAYKSSSQGTRTFCRTCGSVAPTLSKEMDLAILPAGNLTTDLPVQPQFHVFVGSKAPWHTITDGLPQHEEYPPEFGAGGVARPHHEPTAGVVTGSCLCGAVAYELTGAPQRMVNCHCSRCRRGRSAAHATNLFYAMQDFRFTSGAEKVVEYKVPEAKFFTVAFCRDCGGATPRISRERGIAIVPAGTLDDDPGMRPTMHIFVGSKANWHAITDALPQHQGAAP